MESVTTFELLGGRVTPVSIEILQRRIRHAIAAGRREVVANHNLHSLYLLQHHRRLRDFYDRADLTFIDGMSLVLVGRLLGMPLRRDDRVTYVDWLPRLMDEAEVEGWRIFYVGSRPEVAARALRILRARYPRLDLQACHGYFDATSRVENARVLDAIEAFAPNILMVGMGMPRQELWIAAQLERIRANVFLPCGAAWDYVASEIRTPPRWMGRTGLEWLYRLACEPRRLGRRYLVEPWGLIPLLCRDMHRYRGFSLPRGGSETPTSWQ
jgi:N-acetylglucosaminyldiphosphoundecaprenol N-acetyl-beta-D-mannosaminyltransferase